jgi:hypothetical protein
MKLDLLNGTFPLTVIEKKKKWESEKEGTMKNRNKFNNTYYDESKDKSAFLC